MAYNIDFSNPREWPRTAPPTMMDKSVLRGMEESGTDPSSWSRLARSQRNEEILREMEDRKLAKMEDVERYQRALRSGGGPRNSYRWHDMQSDLAYATPRKPERYIAEQSTIPSKSARIRDINAANIAAARDQANRELLEQYELSRGVQVPGQEYYGPELHGRRTVDQFGNPLSYQNVDPNTAFRRFGRELNDLAFGYDPRQGAEGYIPEYGPEEGALFAGSFVPGRMGRMAGAALGIDIAKDIATGKRIPGALDMMWLGGMGRRAAGKAAWMYYQDKLTRAIRKRAERQAARRALNAPTKRVYDVNSRKYIDINPYIEEVPYEEVRF